MSASDTEAPPMSSQDEGAADDSGKVARQTRRGEDALAAFHDEEDLGRVYDYRMLARLWPYVRPWRAYLLGSLIMLLMMAAFGMLRPLVMKEALTGLDAPGGADRLTRYGFILAGVIALEQILAFPQMYWVQIAGAGGMAALRRELFVFLHSRSLGFFDKRPIGRLVTRVTNDVDAIGEMFSSGALNAIGDLVRLVAIVAIMLSLDWQMSLFAWAVVPPVAILVNWTRKQMRTVYREVRVKTARMNAFINEQVNGVDVVQAYAREARSQEEFEAINYAYRAANMRAIVLDATLDAAIEMVSSVCVAAILWYAGGQSHGVSFPTLFAFVAYIDMFFMPVRNLSARYTQIQSALAGAERVFQLLASEDEDARLELASGVVSQDWPPPHPEHAFRFEGVTFGYKPGTPVLEDLNITAEVGDTIALVGPTGSGKSTIASLLLRLYEAQQGTIEVLDRDVGELDRQELRSQFAVVPQDVFLFPGTIATNVAAGDAEPDRARVKEVLERIGALDLVERRQGGIDAEVQERGGNFSAGERQLIAFARALYRDPRLLILDEPTASIDSDTEARLQRAMQTAMAGRTALVIAHRLSTIKDATRIVCLHQGRVVEQGTHDELIEHDGVYARLYRLQVARRAIEERVGRLAGEAAG
ncbi:MAG: ABC transporter ATP-binding protein [Polyangiaceae bacterium]